MGVDIGRKIVGESVENYSSCGSSENNLNYRHEQVSMMIDKWVAMGGTKFAHWKDASAWATDLMDHDLISVGTDNYTDDNADMVVFSGHGGISGTSSTNMWTKTAMCPHNGYSYSYGKYIDFDNTEYRADWDWYISTEGKGKYLVLFTCFSVHDFSKDNSGVASGLQNGNTYELWKYAFKSNVSSSSKDSGLNMVFGFAGYSTDSENTDENGEAFIEDVWVESQKQAWFTGNDDWWFDDRAGVITWGENNGCYNSNSGLDAIGRRDNHKIVETVKAHSSEIAVAWSHHDC
jgi:hypothetical protein